MNEQLIKLIVDNYHGLAVNSEFSQKDVNESIREQLIALNNGSTKLDYKAIRDGKCKGLFALIEEAITRTVVEGFDGNNPMLGYVETRNEALGDSPIFKIEDDSTFVVGGVADGTQALRRQRLKGGEELTVKTKLRGIKIYEEIARVLSGRVDFNDLIRDVADAFQKDIYEQMYNAVVGAFNKVTTPYRQSGTFDEGKLTTIIDHIEAATGKTAIIIGSKQAVRKITGVTGADANSAKEDLYNLGYFGKFHTNPIVALQNMHKVGTDTFILPDDELYIVAGDDKFVKFVHEGDTTIINTESTTNQDLSVEYLMIQKYGLVVVFSDKGHGLYKLQ